MQAITRPIGIALLLLLSSSCSSSPAESSEEAGASPSKEVPVVSVALVEQRLIERRSQAVGQLMADEEVTVSNEVDGRIERITVDFGSQVQTGQLLVVLEAENYRLAVNRAQAGLAESLAALGLPPEGDEDAVEIGQIASVAMARASLEDAQTKLESASQLVKNRDIPEQRYLEAAKLVEQRQAALQEARDRARVQIANVKTNRAQLAIEEDRLSKTQIHAPFSGSVVSKMVSKGQYVKADSALLSLVRDDPLRLRGTVPEGSTALVRKGLKLKFKTDAYPDRWFEAVVSDVSPVLDPETRSLSAEAKVANPDRLLKPGMFAVVDVIVDPSSPALVVPDQAIFSFAGIQKVLVVTSESKISEKTVETGVKLEGGTEILGSALQVGDRVVVSNQRNLQDGMTVRISQDGR